MNHHYPQPLFRRRRGFSLIEVLLAVFILAIGLIMVASIFPVGADWTRQATEDSLSQSIALNALSVIQDNYAPNSLNASTRGKMAIITTSALQPLPAFNNIPINERTYQYGNANPFPSQNPLGCNYYWTALARLSPGQSAPASKIYDLYIFVFRKGDVSQTFQLNTDASTAADPSTYVPLKNTSTSDPYKEVASGTNYARDASDSPPNPFPTNYHWFLEPTLVIGKYNPGTYSSASNSFTSPPFPPIGYTAVGETSGTVFRQNVDFTNAFATPRPYLFGQTSSTTPPNENIIFAPPADNTSASPLIYVYQTTVSF